MIQQLRSIELTKKEKTELQKKVSKEPNQTIAAKACGLNDRFVLGRILKTGSCSPQSYQKITAWISQQ